MSPDEIRFIQTYVQAMRKHYELLRTAINVMAPNGLAVKDFMAAARLAASLQGATKRFERGMTRVARRHKLKPLRIPTGPSLDELADLFSLSFFKLITTSSGEGSHKEVVSDGWFSGQPADWKSALQNLKSFPVAKQSASAPIDTELSSLINAMFKFFSIHTTKWTKPNAGKKVWPEPEAELESWYVEGDEDITDDFDNDPFDWFFGSD